MEFNESDLQEIHLKKTKFIQSYGALDIFSDIEYLLNEVSTYRRKEAEYGWMGEDEKNIIGAMRHLSIRQHAYNPTTCGLCHGAQKVMQAMKAGEL